MVIIVEASVMAKRKLPVNRLVRRYPLYWMWLQYDFQCLLPLYRTVLGLNRASAELHRLCNGFYSGPFSSSLNTLTILGGFADYGDVDSTFCFPSSSLTFQDGSTTPALDHRTVGLHVQSRINCLACLRFESLSTSSPETQIGKPDSAARLYFKLIIST
jgi:hypothetical protein